jgi:hypothetical protein
MIRLAEAFLAGGIAPERAVLLIEAALPSLLLHAPLEEQACGNLVLARAMLLCAGRPVETALPALERAIAAYVQLDNFAGQRDVAYLTARVYHQLGKVTHRDEAARLFRFASELAKQPPGAPLLVAARAVSADACALPGLVQSMSNSRGPRLAPA